MHPLLRVVLKVLLLLGMIEGLLLIHETGHLAVLVASGVEVEEYVVGTGPNIVSFTTPSGTRFSFNALPQAGYVLPDEKQFDDMTRAGKIVLFMAGNMSTLIVAFLVLLILRRQRYRPPIVFGASVTLKYPRARTVVSAFIDSFGVIVIYFLMWLSLLRRMVAYLADVAPMLFSRGFDIRRRTRFPSHPAVSESPLRRNLDLFAKLTAVLAVKGFTPTESDGIKLWHQMLEPFGFDIQGAWPMEVAIIFLIVWIVVLFAYLFTDARR